MRRDPAGEHPARAQAVRDAQGAALGLLALLLAAGTAWPLLGPDGPGFPAGDAASHLERSRPTADTGGPVQAGAGERGAAPPATGQRTKPLAAGPLDLNRADAAALQALPGIGPALAQRIVSYREAHGPFRAVEDLQAVPGIGAKRWEQVRPLVRVAETP